MTEDGDRDGKIAMGCLRTIGVIIAIVIFLGSMAGSSDPSPGASGKAVKWERYDVAIDVQRDGTLHVTERQEVRFTGSFRQGFAEIPLERIEAITNVQVTTEGRPNDLDGNGVLSREEIRAGGRLIRGIQMEGNPYSLMPGEYQLTEKNGQYRIDYAFESTASDSYGLYSSPQVRTIILEYDVLGAIRDYPDAEEPWQQVHWMAISPEVTDIADITEATVTITLPEDVPEQELAYAPEPTSLDANTFVWSRSDMVEGDGFDVQLAFPAITDAEAPAWQPAADAHDANVETANNRKSLASVMLIAAGILVVVGGGLVLLYAWYTRVREPVAGPIPDRLAEPPDTLPAGLVGALVDEQVHPRDIAATIMDLDHRGIIRVRENEPTEDSIFGSRARYALELLQPIESAQPYERTILKSVFHSSARPSSTVSFDALRPLFGAYREEIQTAMDEELVRRGYLEEMPETSRSRWQMQLRVFFGLTVVVAAAILIWTRTWTWWVLMPPALGAVVYLAGLRLTPSIARKTQEGAEVSARWKAFEQHLVSVGNPVFYDEWKQISEKYIPWMVAFGLEHKWLRSMNTPYPDLSRPGRGGLQSGSSRVGNDWQSRTQPGASKTWSGGSFLNSMANGPGWDASRWATMQGSSDNILSSISSGSDSLFSMLGDAMEAMGSSSGSGGGSSGSFSSGGSSRSGGGSSSSSGGGRRGFS